MDWPLLADLSPDDVRALLAIARRRSFAKGEIVVHRDDLAESLHLIVRGRFAHASQAGDSVLLDVLGPGQAFGELALLLPGERRSATVSALEGGETRSVFRDDFMRLQKRGTVALERGRVSVLDTESVRKRCRFGGGS